jgi:hypothetical protein
MMLLVSAGCRSLSGRETPATSSRGVQVTIETRDGAAIAGTLGIATVTIETASAGKVAAPVGALSSIEYTGEARAWKAVFRNGDVLQGALAVKAFEVATQSGPVSVVLERVARITIAHPLLTFLPMTFADPGEAFEWKGLHNVTAPAVSGGALVFAVTGPDPYLHRENMAVPAADCPVLVIRMKKEAGSSGQVFWMTDTQGGFVEPAYLNYKTTPDGKFHDIFVPVYTNPLWRGTITALRIDPDVAGEKGRVEIESISAARLPAAPPETLLSTDAVLAVFDGTPFKAMPEWVKTGTPSDDYLHTTEPGFGYFFVKDAERAMKWVKEFPQPVDSAQWPYIEMEYQASGLAGAPDDYVLWLFDGRPGNYAGFAAIVNREIIADGETHTIFVPLARFNPAGPITGCTVWVVSGPDGWASLAVHRLRFLRSLPAADGGPAAMTAAPLEGLTRFRAAVEMNANLWISLASSSINGYMPVKVRTVRFFEKRHRLYARMKLESETSAAAVFDVRIKLFDKPDATEPTATAEHSYRTTANLVPLPHVLGAEREFDLGPSKDVKSSAAFEVEIEDVTAGAPAPKRSAKSGWVD